MKPDNTVTKSWQLIVGGALIIIGLASGLSLKQFRLDWPSTALIVLGALFFFTPLNDLISRIHKLKFKEMELVLDDLVLPPKLREELSGLSSSDIWALDSFASGVGIIVDNMKPAQRVAARMLLDYKLLLITGDGSERKVSLTPQGHQLLAAAKSVLL